MTDVTAERTDTIRSKECTDPVEPLWEREGRLYIVGLDGLTLDVINPMVASGELPTFAHLKGAGAYGRLATVSPTSSPLIWASIATGRHHKDHGVHGFCFYRIFGQRQSRAAARRLKYGRLSKYGLRSIMKFLSLLGLRRRVYYDGRHIMAKPFWEVVSEGGGNVGVVNWWHTWPARRVNGFVVSDRVHYFREQSKGRDAPERRLTYPAGLLEDLADLILPPSAVQEQDLQEFINLSPPEMRRLLRKGWRRRDPVTEVRWIVSANRTVSRVLPYCLTAFPDVELVVVYLRGPDIAQHAAFQYSPWATASRASGEKRRAYGTIVPEAYRCADKLVGSVVERMGPKDTLLVISDHGFGLEREPGTPNPYGHDVSEPPGVIFACGPEIRPGAIPEQASIYDVAPTVLRLCGFPSAMDMEGRCLEEILTDAFHREYPEPEPLKTYGPRTEYDAPVATSTAAEKDLLEHLRALGYLD